ncbi:hypothetical protein PMAYCL1PPCAC_16060, partial [Pristionchus mayeri]
MNSTGLDAAFERELVHAQHICGAILFVFNSTIVVLIFRDGDIRNKLYRKYLCSVQISSLAFDTLSDMYAPIFMAHSGIMYSNSLLSNVIGVGTFLVCISSLSPDSSTFQAIEFALLGEVLLSYFACVYFRRSVILGRNGKFNLFGWKRAALFICLHIYALVAYFGMIYFARKSIQDSQ